MDRFGVKKKLEKGSRAVVGGVRRCARILNTPLKRSLHYFRLKSRAEKSPYDQEQTVPHRSRRPCLRAGRGYGGRSLIEVSEERVCGVFP